MLKTVSIVVRGKVQGVFFRQSAKEKALELTITGTVENSRDGSVLIIATGRGDQLGELIEWCRSGPPRAIVQNVSVEEIPLRSFDRFTVLR